MKLDFQNMEERHFASFKGGEGELLGRMHADELGKIMYGRLEPGSTIGMHTHETSSEIIYILSGKADILYDDENELLEAGDCHYCPMGHSHSMRNLSNETLTFFAVVPEYGMTE